MKNVAKIFCFFSLLLLVACSTVPEANQQAANYNIELGLSYLQQGNVALAKHKLLLALQQAPHDPMALDAMGYFSEQTGEIKTAAHYYLQAVQRAPQTGSAQNNYGAFLCRQGQYTQAIAHFMLAVNDPNYLNPANAYENAGICALKIPDRELAENYFHKALNSDPNHATALFELANLSYNQRRYSLARSYLQRYMQLVKPNAQAMKLRAQLDKQRISYGSRRN